MADETWATALDGLALLLGGRSEQVRAEAEEWLRQTVEAKWGRPSLHDLTRPERQDAFRRFLATIYDLAGEGEIAFAGRAVVAQAFARRFETAEVPGPPWRLAPDEDDRPTWDEWTDDELPI